MNCTWKDIELLYSADLERLYPLEEIKQLFLLVIEQITKSSSINYVMIKDNVTTDLEFQMAKKILDELKTGRPIQYILQSAHFYGNTFKVSPDTLIPRPETEELVHLVIKDYKGKLGCCMIDIGTGTGCIPISLAYHMPQHSYWAVDVSKEALNIAKQNASLVNNSIQFMEIDILEWSLVFPEGLKFDVIISNPPYITHAEKGEMHRNVLDFEPHLALFVENTTPLLFYDYISDFAKSHLKDEGVVFFEINQYLSSETADLLNKKGFENIQVIKDINGADRIIRAELKKVTYQ